MANSPPGVDTLTDSLANDHLARRVTSSYTPDEYPALAHQIASWASSRPLAGAAVLDATPVFTNTLVKYLALQVAGATVTVSAHRAIPGDPEVIAALPDYGIAVADEHMLRSTVFDVVSDCAGTHSDVASRYGYVELTRSGVAVYADSTRPVFVADAGRIKRIETSLGTGDGFVRGMAALGHPIPGSSEAKPGSAGEPPAIVVFGGGKVGSGVAGACAALGARVTVIDPDTAAVTAAAVPAAAVPKGAGPTGAGPTGLQHLTPTQAEAVREALRSAWCVVAATGLTAALEPWAGELLASGALLANMGATDEFGPTVPAGAALNDKVAVNFVLDEPTRLRYLDPTMALTNAGVVELLSGRVPAGLNLPTPELEEELLQVVGHHGAVAPEYGNLVSLQQTDITP